MPVVFCENLNEDITDLPFQMTDTEHPIFSQNILNG
jgi:hypothetical protein